MSLSGLFLSERSSDIFIRNTVRPSERCAAVQEIADWLEKLGMSEYAQRFAENGISVAALPHLTDHDLKDIGVLLGHRRVMLAAISKLAGAAPATPEPTTRAEPKPQDTAERRQVTVLFSDLVGSTALSARMDPEDLREVISTYQKCVAEVVRRFDGFIAKYLGDGVLVYFGYPRAHEDDAERAVRAGLELISAVSAFNTSVPLQTRVGIATGLVVVGDLIGAGEAQERGIVGETPNLAALPGSRGTEHGRHSREHTKAAWQFVRAARPRGQGSQGHRRTGTGLGGTAAKIG
jgi:class 3 adenylate cyclase